MTTLSLALLLASACVQKPELGDSEPAPLDTAAPETPADPCATRWYPDADGDGHGAEGPGMPSCTAPWGWVDVGGDCDDHDSGVHPDAAEACNAADDDCDGDVDEDYPEPMVLWYPDDDRDGWGATAQVEPRCGGEPGWVLQPGDCDDADPWVNPGSREPCNNRDDDCDGIVDEACGGRCGDGVKGGRYEACDGDDDRACPGACSAHCACPSAPAGELRLHMVDVGQGDALVLISPDGFVMLIDSGSSGYCDELAWYLDSQDIRAIDYTLVTHQHSDHHGGMDTLLGEHPEVVAAFDNDGWFSDASDEDYRFAAVGRRVGLQAGGSIDMGPSVSVEVLHADQLSANENDNSVVLLVRHEQVGILLGGDCEASCERSLDPGPVDIYKVHHHGASDASSDAFLQDIQPSLALISVGEGNAYGHPDASTVRALEELGAELRRTDHHGSVVVESDGSSYTMDGRRHRPHPR